MTNYEKIEKAIVYLKENFRSQPDLDEVARQVYLSPFHFQRVFREWAGVSPKKFLQFLSLEYAKGLLRQNNSLLEASFETGLSGSGRLHDLFITVEGMTPGEYKNGGESLEIQYRFADTVFGKVFIASTSKGICNLAFVSDPSEPVSHLQRQFPNAKLISRKNEMQENALRFFRQDWKDIKALKLHLRGTPFQLKVWRALLQIPQGEITTYAGIAKKTDSPAAVRATGAAVASNPVAFLIPCHRVIRSTGAIGEYHWGAARKLALFGWEAARLEPQVSG